MFSLQCSSWVQSSSQTFTTYHESFSVSKFILRWGGDTATVNQTNNKHQNYFNIKLFPYKFYRVHSGSPVQMELLKQYQKWFTHSPIRTNVAARHARAIGEVARSTADWLVRSLRAVQANRANDRIHHC